VSLGAACLFVTAHRVVATLYFMLAV
jgi:hypothetical protein